ncbi:DUF2797 domain-containing protein [Zafaria sp. Z1313]|uniref:DUF2797 domain-containing protein n=1 Tax=Zafaria sp. Z1313 TaxID=3423202 RepID=UPI003D303D73
MSEQLLCAGLSWPAQDGAPRLALSGADGTDHSVVLEPGTRLAFTVGPGRWCLGHTSVESRTERTHHPCPTGAAAERGTQCGPCFGRDQTRLIHDFHRSGQAPPGLRDYLMQPHWLYVAGFAHGAAKVGTAAAPGKWRRLAEQGAVVASYVALAADGRTVRVLEDAVTRECGLGQAVRAAGKAAGLASAAGAEYDAGALAAAHRERTARVREFLAGVLADAGIEAAPFDEDWILPSAAEPVVAAWGAGRQHAYPHRLDGGTHGFTVTGVIGQGLQLGLDGLAAPFVADASVLKGRRISWTRAASEAPAVQDSLF